jgi:peptide/nickel transport system ATP-binding protein
VTSPAPGVLIITHDLGVVAEFADRALVMYAGRPVEVASVRELYRDRRMPYTAGLLGSVPRLDAPQGARLVPIPGAPPSLADLPPGCPFAPRCPLAIDECRTAEPELVPVGPEPSGSLHSEQNRSRVAVPPISTASPPRRRRRRGHHRRAGGAAGPDLVKTFKLTKGVVLRRAGSVRCARSTASASSSQQGRTLGIVGESGSGKSTTLHQILDLAAPQSGSIEVLGSDVATLDRGPAGAARRPAGGVPGSGGIA